MRRFASAGWFRDGDETGSFYLMYIHTALYLIVRDRRVDMTISNWWHSFRSKMEEGRTL